MTPERIAELRSLYTNATRTDEPECSCCDCGGEYHGHTSTCPNLIWNGEMFDAKEALRAALEAAAPDLLGAVERLTRERNEARSMLAPVRWESNGQAGDQSCFCEVCGQEVSAPHLYKECAEDQARHIASLTDLALTRERERDEARAEVLKMSALADAMADKANVNAKERDMVQDHVRSMMGIGLLRAADVIAEQDATIAHLTADMEAARALVRERDERLGRVAAYGGDCYVPRQCACCRQQPTEHSTHCPLHGWEAAK